jgi:hypothetical protein
MNAARRRDLEFHILLRSTWFFSVELLDRKSNAVCVFLFVRVSKNFLPNLANGQVLTRSSVVRTPEDLTL